MSNERWLFVDGAVMFGGHEVMMLRLIHELSQQARIEPKLLARQGTRLAERAGEFDAGIRFLPVKPTRGWLAPLRSVLRQWRDALTLIRAARRVRPALCIVTEGCILAQPILTATARAIGIRVVVYTPLVDRSKDMGFTHGTLRDWLVQRIYGKVPHGWITITPRQAETLAQWARIEQPILTLPNVVDRSLESMSPANLVQFPRDRSARTAEPLRVLVLGRLDAHQKGLDLLLDFLETEGERTPALAAQFRVSIVGEGGYKSELEQRISTSEALSQIVTLRPWGDTLGTIRQHDALLLPSRFEGVPLVMLEAMALGLPVVASDLPGTRDYLPSECLFQVGDLWTAFAQLEHLRDPVARARIAARNRATFERSSTAAAFSKSVHRLTDELLQLAGAA